VGSRPGALTWRKRIPPPTATGVRQLPAIVQSPSWPKSHSGGPVGCPSLGLATRWLFEAERLAELPKLRGGAWHPYRRKWATARKGLALADVAAAGGWKSKEALLRFYQQPD
jgi:hypothetical protein